MDDVEYDFERLIVLADERSLEREKEFILSLGDQPNSASNPVPAASFH